MTRHTLICATLIVVFGLLGCSSTNTTSGKTAHDTSDSATTKTSEKEKPANTTKASEKDTTKSSEKAKPAKADISKMEFKLPEGWKTNFNKYGYWNVNTNGLVDSFVVQPLDSTRPKDMETWAEKLKEKDWRDADKVWTEITSKEKLPDGFLIKGVASKYKEKDAKPSPIFVCIRNIGGLVIEFSVAELSTDQRFNEAVEIAKTAHFPAPK